MTAIWWAVVAGALVVYLLKLTGYLLPHKFVSSPLVSALSALVTVALLSSLVASQTFGHDGGVVLDARFVAVAVAAFLLWIRTPFIVVIISAALVAAVLRALEWMA